MQDRWQAVDGYLDGLFGGSDPALDEAVRASREAGLPQIHVTAGQGRLLHLLAKSIGACRILEIGTLGGYSTIWLARALAAGGRLVTLELDPEHAAVAQKNIERAGLAQAVEIRLGKAAETMAGLAAEHAPPFDFIFIDADKPSYSEYFTLALPLSQEGTLIVADNVIRNGTVADPASREANVIGVRNFLELAAREPRVEATALQTVNTKGYDGMALILVKE